METIIAVLFVIAASSHAASALLNKKGWKLLAAIGYAAVVALTPFSGNSIILTLGMVFLTIFAVVNIIKKQELANV